MTRRQLKKSARLRVKHNYWRTVIVCFIVATLTGIYGSNAAVRTAGGTPVAVGLQSLSNTQLVNNTLQEYLGGNSNLVWNQLYRLPKASQGILAGVYNNITQSGNVFFGILNAVNQMFFKDRVGAGIIIILGVLLIFFYWAFIGNSLMVGRCRFFIENRSYPETKVSRLLMLFKIRRVRHVGGILFLRQLYTSLWFLTVVGGVIKLYAYRMVPWLLAENPDLTRKEAFLLSRRMMKGYKWRAFCLDASFWGWELLSALTFGLLSILYVHPYKYAADSEFYFMVRENALAVLPGPSRFFTDEYLQPPIEGQLAYPEELFAIPEHPGRKWLSLEHRCHYTLQNYILLFFTFSIFGWLWEVFVVLLNTGQLVDRGTLFGPWLPLYGTGGVLLILLLKRWAERPVLVFVLALGICGVLEYFTSVALEKLTGMRWWEYDGYFLNIKGRVCLEGLLVFGLGGCLAIYFAGPVLNNLFNKIAGKLKTGLCALLLVMFLADLGVSAASPNKAAAIPVNAASSAEASALLH